MSALHQIEKEANALITAALQEQSLVEIPAIGSLCPIFHPEYIWVDDNSENGEKKLIPPHISLSLTPSEYLLRYDHYTSIEFRPPYEYFDSIFISNLADLHNHQDDEVRRVLSSHLESFLKDLFRGRRTTLLNIGDFYITEEGEEGSLLLNFLASEEILNSLNFVFSAYQPVAINLSIDFSDTETRLELHKNAPIQISIPKKISTCELPIEEESIDSQSNLGTPAIQETNKTDNREIEIEIEIENTPESVLLEKKKKKTLIRPILLSGVAIIAAVFIGLSINQSKEDPKIDSKEVRTTTESHPEKADIAKTPKEILPLDTITTQSGSTLAKLARQYYENSYYWVYIYFANHKNIKDPNNLDIGIDLLIPDLKKYQLLADPKDALKEAKEWATLIQLGHFTSYEEDRKKLPMNKLNK